MISIIRAKQGFADDLSQTNNRTNTASHLDPKMRDHALHGYSTPYYNSVLAICQVSCSTAAPLRNPSKADAVWLPKC